MGDYTLSTDFHDLEIRFSFRGLDLPYRPHYNIAPTQDVLTITNDGENHGEHMRWGLSRPGPRTPASAAG